MGKFYPLINHALPLNTQAFSGSILVLFSVHPIFALMKNTPANKLPYLIALDDEKDLLEIFKFGMGSKGYEVDIATEEKSFWNLLKSKAPAVIFLDIQMPGKQGNDLCRELKGNAETSNIPIIMLSGKADAFQLAAHSGADGCIMKPFTCNTVVSEIERIMAIS